MAGILCGPNVDMVTETLVLMIEFCKAIRVVWGIFLFHHTVCVLLDPVQPAIA